MQILQNILDEIYASHIPALLSNLFDPADGAARGIAGFFSAHAGGPVLFDLLLEVEAEFGVELLLDVGTGK